MRSCVRRSLRQACMPGSQEGSEGSAGPGKKTSEGEGGMVRVIVPLGATRAWRAFHSSERRVRAQVRRINKKLAETKCGRRCGKRIGKENTRRLRRIQRCRSKNRPLHMVGLARVGAATGHITLEGCRGLRKRARLFPIRSQGGFAGDERSGSSAGWHRRCRWDEFFRPQRSSAWLLQTGAEACAGDSRREAEPWRGVRRAGPCSNNARRDP